MIKSDEPPNVDYSKLPPETEEALDREQYKREEKAKLTWDGRQFLVRIPKEIAKEMGLTKENFIVFKLIKPRPDSTEKPKLEMELK